MLYVKLRNGRLKIGPADERGEDEIEEAVRILKQRGLSAIEIEADFHEGHHGRDDNYPYGQYRDNPRRYNPYGVPDYTPQHYQMPMIVPVWFGNMGDSRDGRTPRQANDYVDDDRNQRHNDR
jgi:hypothetical protein